MKYFLFLIVNFLVYTGFSQSGIDSVIGFGCGKAPRPTQAIIQLEKLLVQGQYDSIKVLIHSNSPAKQYLAGKICEYLESKKKLTLTTNDKEAINKVKNADYKITYCSGCTIREEFFLKELYIDKSHRLNKEIDRWLKELIQ